MNVPIPRIVCLLSLIGTFAFSAPSEKRIYPAFSYGADHDFGAAVAIDGDHAVVGAPGDGEGGLNAGAAFLFDVASGNQIRKLTASDAAVGDELGDAVAIGGNYIAVGASNKNGDEGAVYVFDRNTGGELHKLVAFGVGDDPMDYADTSFGISLAISGNYLIVGAEGDDISAGNAGAAYIFDLASGNEIHRLDPDDPEASALFGCSVDISGNYALVGSEKATGTSNSGSGAAYLFDVTTGDQIRKLVAADPSEDAMFGAAVAISGTLAVVGAPFDDEGGSDSGAAYVFDVVSGNRTRKLIGPVAESNFGRSLSMSDTHVLVGAPAELVQAAFAAGAGYLMNATDGPVAPTHGERSQRARYVRMVGGTLGQRRRCRRYLQKRSRGSRIRLHRPRWTRPLERGRQGQAQAQDSEALEGGEEGQTGREREKGPCDPEEAARAQAETAQAVIGGVTRFPPPLWKRPLSAAVQSPALKQV
jgi:hypothetical protein